MNAEITGSVIRNANPDGCHQYLNQKWQRLNKSARGTTFKSVLVIGCSSGFGLASRLVALRNKAEYSVGVCFEKAPNEKQGGSAGWHLDQAFQNIAKTKNHHCKTFNQDTFLMATKQAVIDHVKRTGQPFDLVIYSVAAGVKLDEKGEKIRSSILPTKQSLKGLQVDLEKHTFEEMELPSATEAQIADTVDVMGGTDWQQWLEILSEAGALTSNCVTYNYSYLGSDLNAPIYREGTLGAAKDHMHRTAESLRAQGFNAKVVVCKALVTKASLFIPLMAPYLMALKSELRIRNQDEDVFDQMWRLMSGQFRDEGDVIRLDHYELADDVQAAVKSRLDKITTEDFKNTIDYIGVRDELLAMHGFLPAG
jgi:enoyl-[acyl-carrier protein] reductase/trans-2-enoyl-CoA reductase (NAD+)